MARRRRWTLLVVSDDNDPVRQFDCSHRTLRLTLSGALLLAVVLTSLSAGFFIKDWQRRRAQRLAQENELLATEVRQIRDRLASLDDVLGKLTRRGEHYRLLAGLSPISDDVLRAGIGGPGTRTLHSDSLWQLDPELGEKTFEASYNLGAMLRQARLLASSWTEATDSLMARREEWTTLPSIIPTDGYISSRFTRSRWHPILHRPRPHEGLDISAPIGTPILATAAGRVTFTGRNGGYGKMVEISHGDGLVTRYAHASRILVERGAWVERGDTIAEVGSTGLSTGPHVHYEVVEDGQPERPSHYILDLEVIPD